jgi:glycosyltransferase involved in cell wall biosynthesis
MSASAQQSQSSGVVLIPAYNEEATLPTLLAEVRREVPELVPVVINDGSVDRTAAVARLAGVQVIDLPCNLGVGGAVQAGMRYALEQGYDFAVRIDGDGQHPPAEIPRLLQVARVCNADLIVGSRFGVEHEVISTRLRYAGIKALALFLSLICRSRISDPTSGFWMVKRSLLTYFAHEFPTDYPEPEALALLRRQGYSFAEVAVRFRPRQAGVSSIRAWGTVYYALKVGLALVVDRVRPVNRVYAREVTSRSA